MMRSRWWLVAFGVGVLAVLAAMAWITRQSVALEARERDAQREARYQESLRLVLWRMDARLTPIVAREAARPYFEYKAFYPAGRAYTNMLRAIEPGEVLVPSPLLRESGEFVRLYFQIDASGEITSPQAPEEVMRKLAEGVYAPSYTLERREDELAALQRELTATELGAAVLGARPLALRTTAPSPDPRGQMVLRSRSSPDVVLAEAARESTSTDQMAAAPERDRSDGAAAPAATPPVYPSAAAPPRQPLAQSQKDDAPQLKSQQEYASRQRAAELAKNTENVAPQTAGQINVVGPGSQFFDTGSDLPLQLANVESPLPVVQTAFEPVWLEAGSDAPMLLFVRRVMIGEESIQQGFWLDWPALQRELEAIAGETLPQSQLRPIVDRSRLDDPEIAGRSLAVVPAELLAPMPPMPAAAGVSPVVTSLILAWTAVLAAVLMIALVMRSFWDLAERRGRFVSAVTHELRTPLTTFCLYSDMLAGGMVRDEDRRTQYLSTLRNESRRLSAIVESVLDYARLGRSSRANRRAISAADLLGGLAPVLQERCRQGALELRLVDELGDESAKLTLTTDPGTIERIVFNLIDNACKYGDGEVVLTMTRCGKDLCLSVRDHGPGLDGKDAKEIFRPFVRGRRQADGSTPGLGLGLALSHGLAKQLGGSLTLRTPDGGGAEFVLRLPIA